ncbi:MAG: PorT family protein [Chlorobi bacterium]|nr:PorT family protein [Chlorobiota bacterium]
MKTKVFALLAGVFLYFVPATYSQKFIGGPKAGIAFTQVDGDFYGGFHKAGVNLGAFVYRTISKNQKWDLQFEIEYIQKGSRETPDPENGLYTDYKMSLNYIQIPVFARYNARHLSFEAGVSVGTLFSSTEYTDGVEIPEEDQVPFKSMELAALTSINYHFNPKLWLNARFSYSLTRIRVPYNGEIPVYDPDPWDLQKPGQYNNVIVFSFYYAFGGNHKL